MRLHGAHRGHDRALVQDLPFQQANVVEHPQIREAILVGKTCPTAKPIDLVVLLQQELRQIGAVLTGDARYQRALLHGIRL
jgi:hypothetical protein